MVGVLPDRRDLAVGFGHKLLQLFFEELVSGLGFRRGCGRGTGRAVLIAVVGGSAFSAEIVPGGILTLRLGLQSLDRKIDLAVVGVYDHDLNILAFGQMLADITDEGVGYLGNMYQTGLVIGQCHKSTEICDGLYLAL